jgi:MoxR-like ATPase
MNGGGTSGGGNRFAGAVKANVAKVIVGKEHVVEHLLVALLSRGHVLIEDVPGVGKTSLMRALSDSLGLTFRRLQFTPDLMSSDVTGISIYDAAIGSFRFQPGPIFTQVLLADEINRTSPKTQSSLLEAMEEGQVTADGTTYPLPSPFFVLATQNPIEFEGTFPLPEAQLDRFMLKLAVGYPSLAEEVEILDRRGAAAGPVRVSPVTAADAILEAQDSASQVFCATPIREYIVRLVQRTRQHHDVYLGSSPRGSLALLRGARSLAYVRGRGFVLPDDVKELLVPALEHRILLKAEARLAGVTPKSVLQDIASLVAVPVGLFE